MFEGNRGTVLVLLGCALAWAFIVLRQADTVLEADIHEAIVPQAEVEAFAREQLAKFQRRSIAENVELCGMVAERANGELVLREEILGSEDRCNISYFDVRSLYPRATIHTHGAHSASYDSEVPSLLDMQGDIASQTDGYIATPGGRFWHIDWQAEKARLVCGAGCLPSDPAYRACDTLEPQESYNLLQLQERESVRLPVCQADAASAMTG
ncbi:DUF4329 domain-containing protein [Paraurantiacibacter namhicola]|uniref:DUF4329 domain-containing protein n=1 Tax=Paraurantiacibacter namhicola TaxID=645517 RepID=A0A1C7D996_9SPHN|nr:DUF4329 domain-containing protein [Paraurantiacibacter namhicola]ANU07891.1 hypothetical protein A6F65_01592 [Paraurantiacibacter namhicola]